ncbi:YWFCY domain-containing protein [Myroides odoratimimus]|uniref:YWFCY domain-containing protein n=1 Tax=Myroides odoratimimus TaxID=76832 RepID=UPI0025760537|nr:YWFCY domain-containing protein [Myroides odoratimimus]MEC4076567.1 YWFCY domain-containing protein [Myroides odoratimimus]
MGNKGVKHQKITLKKIIILFCIGASLFFLNSSLTASLYIISLSIGYIPLLVSGAYINKLIKENNSTTKLKLRKVKFFSREHKREFLFITNLFQIQSDMIAALYKLRWQIEVGLSQSW